MTRRFIITNFAYGFGPFLRTTELALAVADRLATITGDEFAVVVPWVYGERQKRILLEEFASRVQAHPRSIFLDRLLGTQLARLFYGVRGFNDALRCFRDERAKVTDAVNGYLARGLQVETLAGERETVPAAAIALAVSRAPRVAYDLEWSYYTGFGYVSEILERSLASDEVAVDRDLWQAAIPAMADIERSHRLHFVADPGTFNFLGTRAPRFAAEVATPPNARAPSLGDCTEVERGIYVTVTGIPGLERLFDEARSLGYRLYTNEPAKVPGATAALPHALQCPTIALHFARAGWGSIWYSLLTGVPFIAPRFDATDDPEIFFNNLCIERIGLGLIYNGQPLGELLAFGDRYRTTAARERDRLLRTYGTLDGVGYTADRIVQDFIQTP